jgi:hypothetical protein
VFKFLSELAAQIIINGSSYQGLIDSNALIQKVRVLLQQQQPLFLMMVRMMVFKKNTF